GRETPAPTERDRSEWTDPPPGSENKHGPARSGSRRPDERRVDEAPRPAPGNGRRAPGRAGCPGETAPTTPAASAWNGGHRGVARAVTETAPCRDEVAWQPSPRSRPC